VAILIILAVLAVTNYIAFQTGKAVGRTDAVTERVDRLVARLKGERP
jgi:Tfp pilus assembly protein FimT